MHICRNNQCPARGRKSQKSIIVITLLPKQSMPRQGTEIFDFPFISYDSNETINAPSGDGNIPVLRIKLRAVLKQSMPRQGTEIAKASRLDTAP